MAQSILIKNLQNPALYDHPIKSFQVIETHISWVILTGHFAYKIKKPINFEFLDFSTLERRKYFYEKEFKLNQSLASNIYQSVIAISGSPENPLFSDKGPIIEYALKMREFPQDVLFDKVLARNELTPQLIDELAKIIANFHKQAAICDPASFLGTPAQIYHPVQQNFQQIRPLLSDDKQITQLNKLANWAEQQYVELKEILQQRKDQGFIRSCHGDIHLGNIILEQGHPIIFDCIEFNEEFRWTDVMADLAFIYMDLEDNKRSDFALRLINNYFEHTGDYAGLRLLAFYAAYRAVVRAKISQFRLAQSGLSIAERQATEQKYQSCMALAESYAQKRSPTLMITYGVSGSGKSTLAKMIVEQKGAIQIRADVERKRLFGLDPMATSNSALNSNIYTEDANEKTYNKLAELATLIIKAGHSVIVDATFLKKAQRETFNTLASTLGIPFLILRMDVPDAVLKQRVTERRSKDASEACLEVLKMQQIQLEPITIEEQSYTLTVNTADPTQNKQLMIQLDKYL